LGEATALLFIQKLTAGLLSMRRETRTANAGTGFAVGISNCASRTISNRNPIAAVAL
jgi:hypothetical protein